MGVRLTIAQWLDENGYDREDVQELSFDWLADSIAPALCGEGCDVEPDGRCPHGNPSILLAMGVV
jgi:hypothetical protein